MFIAESAVRLAIYRGGERTGHAVVWGVVNDVTLSADERIQRIWGQWFPHLVMLVWLPLGVGFAELTLARMATSHEVSQLLNLYFYLHVLQGIGAAIAVPVFVARMTKRIREGKRGFAAEET